jgi:cytochrome c
VPGGTPPSLDGLGPGLAAIEAVEFRADLILCAGADGMAGQDGTVPGYNYSDVNKNSGIVWDEATFKEYIKDPRAKIPGTKMTFPGIKNEQEINDLWAYLKQFDADGNIKK